MRLQKNNIWHINKNCKNLSNRDVRRGCGPKYQQLMCHSTKCHTLPPQTPKIVYLIGVEGITPQHTLNTLWTSLTCVRSNLKWLLLSIPTRIGSLVTLRWRLMMQTFPEYFCTGITLQPSQMMTWWSWMVDGRVTPPNHVWTHYVMLSALLVRVSSRRISLGMCVNLLVKSMEKVFSKTTFSPTVTLLPEMITRRD